jgi:hypothetical protein
MLPPQGPPRSPSLLQCCGEGDRVSILPDPAGEEGRRAARPTPQACLRLLHLPFSLPSHVLLSFYLSLSRLTFSSLSLSCSEAGAHEELDVAYGRWEPDQLSPPHRYKGQHLPCQRLAASPAAAATPFFRLPLRTMISSSHFCVGLCSAIDFRCTWKVQIDKFRREIPTDFPQ